jgi:hypothetical protein
MARRFGLEILCPRQRRRPQMPNAIPVLVEHHQASEPRQGFPMPVA